MRIAVAMTSEKNCPTVVMKVAGYVAKMVAVR